MRLTFQEIMVQLVSAVAASGKKYTSKEAVTKALELYDALHERLPNEFPVRKAGASLRSIPPEVKVD